MAKKVYSPPVPSPPKGATSNVFHEDLLGDDTVGTLDVSKLPKPPKKRGA